MKPKLNSRRALCDKQDNTQVLPPAKIAKAAISPSDPPQIDKEKLYSCIYKLVPKACLFTIVPIPREQGDQQLTIEAIHTIQPPITPNGTSTDQAGDVEQPNTCAMIEGSHNVQPPITPNGNLTDQAGDVEQPNTCVTIEGTHNVQLPTTSDQATSLQELDCMNEMGRLSSSLDVDHPSMPEYPLDMLQHIEQPTMSTYHSEELAPSSQDVDLPNTLSHPVGELTVPS